MNKLITQHTYNGFVKQATQYGITKEAAGKLWEMLSKGLLSSGSLSRLFGSTGKYEGAQRLIGAPHFPTKVSPAGGDFLKTILRRESNISPGVDSLSPSNSSLHPSIVRKLWGEG